MKMNSSIFSQNIFQPRVDNSSQAANLSRSSSALDFIKNQIHVWWNIYLGQPKIGQLHMTSFINEAIIRLDISVNYFVITQKFQGKGYFGSVERDHIVAETSANFQKGFQVASY